MGTGMRTKQVQLECTSSPRLKLPVLTGLTRQLIRGFGILRLVRCAKRHAHERVVGLMKFAISHIGTLNERWSTIAMSHSRQQRNDLASKRTI